MGQVLHGSATTTEAIRRAIQHSQESLRTLAGRYGGTCFENLQQIRRSGASGLAVLAQLVDGAPALNLSDGVSIARSDVVVEFARPMRTFALEASTGSPNGI